MDGSNVIPDEQKTASNLSVRRAEVLMTAWGHIVEEGTDWIEATRREYWLGVAQKFSPGDSISVQSFDRRVRFTVLVLDANTSADPIYLDLAFLPLYPPDLRLPTLEPQREPRYQVRLAPGSSSFRVIDTSTGLPTHDNTKDKFAANELAAELNRGLAASAAQMASVVTVKPVATAGALRTRRYRAKQRGAKRAPAHDIEARALSAARGAE